MSETKFTPVAEVAQREPFLDGSPNPMKELRWSIRNCEDDLPVGALLYVATEANAHLIAAAPELYEALSKCREWVKLAADHPAAEPGVYEALSALEAAIAKARGELP